jgi:FkbM family methyltransferase
MAPSSPASPSPDTVSPNRPPFGPRTKRKIALTGISGGLIAASNFYQRVSPLDAFDIYEQLATTYPEHSIEILAELYDLYQALPDKEGRYSLYQARLFDFGIRPSDRVLDVGSGNVPFPLATHLADLAPHDNNYGRAGAPFKHVQGKPIHLCDIENMDCFADKEFDFVYCSHVLEHVRNPENACRELMRIGKRGYIETPTRGKDLWLSTAKVSNHVWSVEFLHSKLIFTEYLAEELEGLQSDLLMSMHLRPESKREKALTSLMYLKAHLINTMLLWEGEFEYEVLRHEVVAPDTKTGTARKTINLRPTKFAHPDRLNIYADRKYLPRDTPHTPLLVPLWGDIDDERNPDQSRYRRYSLTGKDYFVQTDLSRADIALLPGDWTHCQLEGHRFAEALRGSHKPAVIFFFNDSEEAIAIENSIVFRTSLRRSTRRPNEFAVPGWSVDFGERYFHAQIPIREKQSRPTVGFCGFVPLEENNLRRRAVNALGSSGLVRTNFLLRSEFWAGALGTTREAIQRVRQEYADNMADNDYVLCIRGAGNFSYRLYEVLSSGRIPVFVDTDCVLPYEDFIDWKKYCVWVNAYNLDSIGERTMAFHESLSPQDFLDLQQACRDLWVKWLSPEGFFANFHRHFARVCAQPNAASSIHEPSWIAQNMGASTPLGPRVARSSSTRCRLTPSDTPISRSDISAPSPAIVSKPIALNPVTPLSEGDFCRTIEKIVQPGWTCADIGANVGIITEVLAEYVGPSGKVLAFEAHPTNARILRKNMRSKGYGSRVKVGNVAITDGTQPKVWLYAGRNASDCEWNIVGHDVDGNPTTPELEVTAAKLDTFFPPGRRLDLVKIDIEGAAGPALAGMSRLLKETRPLLLIEFHDEAEWETRAFLFNADYDLWDLHGTKLDPNIHVKRLYHCMAIPSEQDTEKVGLTS